MRCLRSSRSVTRLLYTFSCSMSHTLYQLDFNSANLETTIEAEWFLNFLSSCENGIFQSRQNYVLLLICDTIHNRMTSQQCDTNLYCTVVSHACIHAPLVRSQAKPKIVRSYRQHGNVTEYGKPLNPTLDLQVALFASSKNTRCAASDVNPFKIRFNLQITKATVNETQWGHVINDVTDDVKWTSAVNETQWLHVIT